MTREEAIKKINAIKKYLITGNPIWDVKEIDEVLNMAIEALVFPQEQAEETKPAARKRGRPKKDDLVRGNSVQEGLTEEYTRATFILRVDLVEKIKNYAYTERLTMKEAANKLLGEALEREEKRLAKDGVEIISNKGVEGAKDCIHGEEMKKPWADGRQIVFCWKHGKERFTTSDWYCANGERAKE